jgi:dolichyl-phosphate beta-glucosyltransferase
MELSIVVPAFNEEQRLAASLERLGLFLASVAGGGELVVVDDGSTDGTAGIVRAYAARAAVTVRLLENGANRGKGASVRRGLLDGHGRILLFSDADLSTPIEEAPRLLEPIRSGRLQVAIGSRAVDRSLIGRSQALPRNLLGRAFNVAIRALTGIAVHDTQCGFKAFLAAPVRPLVEALRIEGFGFDVELLGLCAAAGLSLGEIPVPWNHVDGSKVHVLRDGVRMLRDSAAFARRLRRGAYESALAKARAERASSAVG